MALLWWYVYSTHDAILAASVLLAHSIHSLEFPFSSFNLNWQSLCKYLD